MHPESRPAGYKHVRAIGDDVQSLNKIEIPKNKNFQNVQIFTPLAYREEQIRDFLFLQKHNYYPPPEIEGLSFPRLKLFRKCGYLQIE